MGGRTNAVNGALSPPPIAFHAAFCLLAHKQLDANNC